jgi:hypothetical protein
MKKFVPLAILSVSFLAISSSFAYTSDELDGANFLAGNKYIVDYSTTPEKYRLDDSITRKEVMKIVANVAKADLSKATCTGTFSDVKTDDWGCKYIEWGIDKVITKNPTFRPDANISKSEALKMIFKVKWIENTATGGTWQENYVATAYAKGWFDTQWTDYTTPATRGWIFASANRIINDIKVTKKVDDTDAVLNDLFDLLK